MAKTYESLTEELQAFIRAQHLFFVATAPLSADGHLNLSPKGLDCFRILSPRRVAYLDLTGSGNEASAHLHENGRIVFMFCAFEASPSILRLYGTGQVILPDSAEWSEVIPHFRLYPGVRQIITADITRVQTSCGFGVPRFDYVDDRDSLSRWAETKGDAGLAEYRQEKNAVNIDGLPTPLAFHPKTTP